MKKPHSLSVALRTVTAILILCSSDALFGQEKSKSPYLPTVFGLLKSRFEADTQQGKVRFNIPNARVGVKGSISPYFKYQFQVDLNTDGKFSVLDTYGTFVAGDFEVSLGQQLNRFDTELNRGPTNNYFASSSFIASYVGSYYQLGDGVVSSGNFGARDIGVIAKYTNHTCVPINIQAGILNGAGINNPVWSKTVNFVARAWIDPGTVLGGFGLSGNYYTGHTPFGEPFTMAGGELRYVKGAWRIEGEYAGRWLTLSPTVCDRMDLAAVHAIFTQPVKGWGPIQFIAPMVRWDYANNLALVFGGSTVEHFNANRATGGITIGFAPRLLKCELRLNYEHYFLANASEQVLADPRFHNKVMVELFLTF